MKTAISLPDDLFDAADVLAAELGVSRSELYARAVEEFVAKHRHLDITDRLNAVYAAEPSGMDPALRRAQAQSLDDVGW
jgi:metal-responsive CopG/Arc/MetJ family transcriptional regulator